MAGGEVEEIEVDDIDLVDAYFEPIYSALSGMGVADDRMPTTIQIVSHLVEMVPETLLHSWMEAYARAEAPMVKR